MRVPRARRNPALFLAVWFSGCERRNLSIDAPTALSLRRRRRHPSTPSRGPVDRRLDHLFCPHRGHYPPRLGRGGFLRDRLLSQPLRRPLYDAVADEGRGDPDENAASRSLWPARPSGDRCPVVLVYRRHHYAPGRCDSAQLYLAVVRRHRCRLDLGRDRRAAPRGGCVHRVRRCRDHPQAGDRGLHSGRRNRSCRVALSGSGAIGGAVIVVHRIAQPHRALFEFDDGRRRPASRRPWCG